MLEFFLKSMLCDCSSLEIPRLLLLLLHAGAMIVTEGDPV